jgi:excisionase family DNA binding protein
MHTLTPNRPPSEADLLPPQEVAHLLGITTGTLEVWRCTKRYSLKFVKVGRLVRYRRSDLSAFIESRTIGGAPSAEGV